MEGVNKELSLISYNCQHADDLRLPFLKDLFDSCDFLFLQEHGLFQSKLTWLDNIGTKVGLPNAKVGIHGVSAMDENKPLRGRPHGGAVILWHDALEGYVNPIFCDSNRFCAVTYDNGINIILIVCIYMPCDDWRPDGNVIEYIDILHEIQTLSFSVKADFICIGGDLNTDLGRNTHQTNALKGFVAENDLFCCALSNISSVKYTYKSKINNRTSFIDHFLLSNNLTCKLLEFSSIDDINNISDHLAIKCTIDINISYNNKPKSDIQTNGPNWNLTNEYDISMYM